MLSRSPAVAIAAAVSVGKGAAAPRWSGTDRTSNPTSSACFSLSTSRSRDLKKRMLIPKRKSLGTNILRFSELRQLPGSGRARQAMHQGTGNRGQAVVAGQRSARAQAPYAHAQLQLRPPVTHPVDGVVRMQAPQFRRDVVEVGDDLVAGQRDVAGQVVGQGAIAAAGQQLRAAADAAVAGQRYRGVHVVGELGEPGRPG